MASTRSRQLICDHDRVRRGYPVALRRRRCYKGRGRRRGRRRGRGRAKIMIGRHGRRRECEAWRHGHLTLPYLTLPPYLTDYLIYGVVDMPCA